jgi:hypothetical protein
MLNGIKFAFYLIPIHDPFPISSIIVEQVLCSKEALMKKLALILFTLLTIGVIAPASQAQWRHYYPYWGYHPYYWGPFYDFPVVVYDPVEARKIDIRDNLEKLNEAKNRLVSLTSTPTDRNIKEVREQAQKVVKYSKRLERLLSDRDFSNAEPSFVGPGAGLETIRATAQTIDSLVEELNRTDIDVGEVVNMSRTEQTVSLLRQIESYARGIERLIPDRG